MWIQGLFLDAFDGSPDLAWDQVSDSLQAVRVATQADADLLAVSIMELLGHSAAPRSVERQVGRRCGGSMMVRHGSATVDLCRLPAREPGQWEERQILSSHGEPADTLEALRLLQSQPAGLTWSLCSDLIPPASRFALWRRAGLWDRLAVQVSDEASNRPSRDTYVAYDRRLASAPDEAVGDRMDDAGKEQTADRMAVRSGIPQPALIPLAPRPVNPDAWFWSDLEKRYPAWRQTMLELMAHAESEPNLGQRVGQAQVASRQATREAYLMAKQQLVEAETRREELERQRAQLQADDQAWELAESVSEMWSESDRLLQTPLGEATVTEQDVLTLRKIDQQLLQVRRRLKECRAAQESVVATDRPIVHETVPRDAMRRQLEVLLERWERFEGDVVISDWLATRDSLSTIDEEDLVVPMRRAARGDRAISGDMDTEMSVEVDAPRELSEANVLRRLRQLSQRWRDARRELDEARLAVESGWNATGAALADAMGGGALAGGDAQALQDRRESLQRQIRQLRDETRLLLARQLLSRPALLGIGLLFSIGVATLLAALLLDLQNAQMAAGAVGITCILTALFLKASFESAPADELKKQRLRVQQLLQELSELQLPWEEFLAASNHEATDQSTARESAADYASFDATMDSAASTFEDHDDQRGLDASQSRFAAMADPTDRLALAQRATDEAFEDWQRFLAEHNLPIDASPADALRFVQQRRRTARSQRLQSLQAERREARSRAEEARRVVHNWCRDAADWWNAQDHATEPCPVDECTPRQWHERLQRERAYCIEKEMSLSQRSSRHQEAREGRLVNSQDEHDSDRRSGKRKGHRAASVDGEVNRVAQEELQQRLKQLKRRRQKLCERTGWTQLAELEAALAGYAKQLAARQEGESMRRELELLLSESPHGNRVLQWLEESAEIGSRAELHRQKLRDVRSQIARLDAQQQEWRDEIAQWADERPQWTDENASQRANKSSVRSRTLMPQAPWQIDLIKMMVDGVRRRRDTIWETLHPAALLEQAVVPATELPANLPDSRSDRLRDELSEGQPPMDPLEQLRSALEPAAVAADHRLLTEERTVSEAERIGVGIDDSDREALHGVRRPLPLRPLLRATSWLRSVTGQRDLQLHLIDPREDGADESNSALEHLWDALVWSDGQHGDISLAQMAKDQRHLVILCIQLALADELRAEIGSPPWIFTDRSLEMPDRMVRRWMERLSELAAEGQQILLLTAREEVERWCRELQVPVLHVAAVAHAPASTATAAVPPVSVPPVVVPSVLRADERLSNDAPMFAPPAAPFMVPDLPMLDVELPIGPARPALVSPGELVDLDEHEELQLPEPWKHDRLPLPRGPIGEPASVSPPIYTPPFVLPPPVTPPRAAREERVVRAQTMIEPPVLQPSVVVVRPAIDPLLPTPGTLLETTFESRIEPKVEATPRREPLASRPIPEKKYEVVEVAWERAG